VNWYTATYELGAYGFRETSLVGASEGVNFCRVGASEG
jgi:hypothetical protein